MKRHAILILALGLLVLSCHKERADLQMQEISPIEETDTKTYSTEKADKNVFKWNGWTFYLAAKNPDSKTRELKVLNSLKGFIKNYDLSPWIRAKDIYIDDNAISQSDPLTINTRLVDDPESLLATFVHEQIHHLEFEYPEAFSNAMEEVETLFPDLPPELASAPKAAYRHFIVIYFEIDALKRLLGEATALEVIGRKDKNVWIYQTILAGNNAEKLRNIYRKYDLDTAYQ